MPGASIALQDDATQPINIKAQAVLIDEKKGISIYTGKASVVQGSLILSAEKIQLFSNQTQVTKMIANGDKKQRAHYQQSQPTQPRFIEATANKITYMVQKEMVHLKGNAHLVQGFDSFSGGSLDYDIKKDKVIANKSKDGLQRVRFKIKL
ncbi:lipopolysaccharide transport periplasmic protein LptA [Candidatus Thioglobus sp.]|nr:lipopolysaccharide transport periplasmic protein LptA [Candidatus Thioglobus sp.]